MLLGSATVITESLFIYFYPEGGATAFWAGGGVGEPWSIRPILGSGKKSVLIHCFDDSFMVHSDVEYCVTTP